jgi:dihydropteroate synthase
MSEHLWQVRDQVLRLGPRPLVMGILNVTPDSFSDGGRHASTEAAVAHALDLVEQGADLLDVGGESTRPGATPVSLDEELHRVLPVVERLAGRTALPLSVDTSKAEVARAALAGGAHVINDVTALAGDPAMPEVARTFGAGVILLHMRGTPATMQQSPHYADVTAEVYSFFEARLQVLADSGIAREQTVLDPGIGFGKALEHNLELLARLERFLHLGRPVCLGVSRKGFIGQILERPVEQRLAGSLAAICYAQGRGAVQIVRVHDVRETRDAVTLIAAIERQARTERSS